MLEIHCQKHELQVKTILKKNEKIINQFNFIKTHPNLKSIEKEIKKLKEELKRKGYFTSEVKKQTKEEKLIIVYFKLGKKTSKAKINVNKYNLFNEQQFIVTDTDKINDEILKISKILEKSGFTFSEVALKNIQIKKDTLYADLHIKKSKQRKIDKTVFKNYKNFPKNYLKNFFKINSKTIFTKNKLEEITDKLKLLDFIEIQKKPAVLFKKDSTIIYLYIEKKKNNTIDGLINLNTEDNGKLKINGYIDLKLRNTFNSGEEITVLWNRFDKDRQELIASAKKPYIFNSSLTIFTDFSIYKQDSSFLNTNFKLNLNKEISTNSQVGIFYTNTSSKKTQKNMANNIESFTNNFIGLSYNFNKQTKNEVFLKNKFKIDLVASYGKRQSASINNNQLKIEAKGLLNLKINNRNNFLIQNKSSLLNSNTFLTNELFRIGGINSIRGFNEQSIFTSKYSIFNLEYHFLTSNNSEVFTITDFGIYKNNKESKKITGLGIGYSQKNPNSLLTISYVIGKQKNESLNYENSKILISLINFF